MFVLNDSQIISTTAQVLERIKDPLQTMISRDRFEMAYAVLTNFLIIVQRAPLIFSQVECQNTLSHLEAASRNKAETSHWKPVATCINTSYQEMYSHA